MKKRIDALGIDLPGESGDSGTRVHFALTCDTAARLCNRAFNNLDLNEIIDLTSFVIDGEIPKGRIGRP